MKDPIRILYLEDDEYLAFVTRDNLEQRGYNVSHFASGEGALDSFTKDQFDICILDVMLPDIDGFRVAEKMRERNPHIPILFLTARSMKEDKITGFRTGADDYITKPFSIDELVMRLEVFLRRCIVFKTDGESGALKLGRYFFNQASRELTGPENTRTLTRRESDLLKYLVDHANQRLRREDILRAIWETEDYFSGRSLDVFISRLRKYLKDDGAILLENIHGVGFCLQLPPE